MRAGVFVELFYSTSSLFLLLVSGRCRSWKKLRCYNFEQLHKQHKVGKWERSKIRTEIQKLLYCGNDVIALAAA